MFERSRAEAESAFLESARNQEDPATYIHLTFLYATQRRFGCALDSPQRARVINPFDPGPPSPEMFVWLSQRDFRGAVEAGAAAMEVQPYFYPDRALYAEALEFSGFVDEALTQYRAAQTLAPDIPWLKALEAGCLARSGYRREAAIYGLRPTNRTAGHPPPLVLLDCQLHRALMRAVLNPRRSL